MLKIELIAPCGKEQKKSFLKLPPISLGVVGASTPKDIDVCLTDEYVTDIDFEKAVDLVAITSMTATAPRAYEIADKFRQRGIKVAIGGIHASALPNEAAKHVDAVVIGEAENTWPELIKDFRNGNLQRFYQAAERPNLEHLVVQRRELFDRSKYGLIKDALYTTRGCPFDCSFCTVTKFFGNSFRTRPVKEVEEELKGLESRIIVFLDDNLTAKPNYAKELFKAIKPYNKKWFSQSSLKIAKDKELLKLAKEAGCIGLFIGFESLSAKSLKEAGKSFNKVEGYADAIKTIQDHGIAVEGSFIFGLDNDGPSVFEETVKFAIENNIEGTQFNILTPYPGTRLYEKLEEENRIIDRDWSKYDFVHVVYQPKNLSVEQLQEGLGFAYKEFYSTSSITKRLIKRLPGLGNFPYSSIFITGLNFGYKSFAKAKNHQQKDFNRTLSIPEFKNFIEKCRGGMKIRYNLVIPRKKLVYNLFDKEEHFIESFAAPIKKYVQELVFRLNNHIYLETKLKPEEVKSGLSYI